MSNTHPTAPQWFVSAHGALTGIQSGARVPTPLTRNPCGEEHRISRWVCSRRTGHGDRHAAALSSGLVVAVW